MPNNAKKQNPNYDTEALGELQKSLIVVSDIVNTARCVLDNVLHLKNNEEQQDKLK